MLRVDKKVFERVIARIVGVTDVRELAEEFSKDRIFFCSLLKDISMGRDSPNYYVLREFARDMMISEQFIVEQAKSVLSVFAPDEPKEDYYKILNVSPRASTDEIRKSWLKLVKAYHPDKVGERGLDITKNLNEAYEVLGNPVKRGEYDAKCLPTMPVTVIGHSNIRVGSKSLMYSASLSIIILAVVFYIVKSGLLFRADDEKGEITKEGAKPSPTGVISSLDMKKLLLPKPSGERVSTALLPSPKGVGKAVTSEAANLEVSEKEGKIVVESKQESRPSIAEKITPIETRSEEKKESVASLSKLGKAKKAIVVRQSIKSERTSKEKKTTSGQKPKYGEIKRRELEEEINVSGTSIQGIRPPYDKNSLYSFISDYASAYKSRDMNLFMSFFEPDARENGIEVSRAISLYEKNFSSLEIIKYDIRIKSIDFRDNEAFVNGGFVILFRDKGDREIRISEGVINWALLWQDNRWRIKELNYAVNH